MKRFVAILFVVSLASFAVAQTVTVDASLGSPDNSTTFNSLQTAVKSFQASGGTAASTDGSGVGVNHGNVAADIINVVSSSLLDEWVVIDALAASGTDQVVLDEDLTIQGSGGQAILAAQMYSSANNAAFGDCGFCWRQDVNLTVKDLIIIPSRTNTPTDDGIYLLQTTNATDKAVTFDNVILTANDGADAPVTLTGLDEPDLTGATVFGDDGMYIVSRTEGGSITFNATNFIVSNILNGANNDGLLVYMSGATNDVCNAIANLGEGCVISNIDRFGIQNPYGGYVNIQGTKDNPFIMKNIDSDGIWNYSDTAAPSQGTICEVNYAIFVDCGGSALKEQETNNRGFVKSVSNAIFAHCGGPAIELYAAGAVPPTGGVTSTVSVSNVTIHNCGFAVTDPGTSYDFRAAGIASPYYSGTNKSNRNVDIVDTIITGNFGSITGLYNSSDGTYSIDYSALTTESNFFENLLSPSGGPSTITVGSNVISLSPIYVTADIADFASADLCDVRNPAFGGAGSGGADLAGGADFIGDYTPPLGANSWILYQ